MTNQLRDTLIKFDRMELLFSERDLTLNILSQLVDELEPKSRVELNVLLGAASYYCDDWPEGEGFGSSDYTAVFNTAEADLNYARANA